MKEYKIGDIYLSDSRLFVSIIVGINDIGIFARSYHFSGKLVAEREFTNFCCFENNYRLVTLDEFKKEIEDWKKKIRQEYLKNINMLNKYEQTIIDYVDSKG